MWHSEQSWCVCVCGGARKTGEVRWIREREVDPFQKETRMDKDEGIHVYRYTGL